MHIEIKVTSREEYEAVPLDDAVVALQAALSYAESMEETFTRQDEAVRKRIMEATRKSVDKLHRGA